MDARWRAAGLAPVALFAALALCRLGDISLWSDEGYQACAATLGWSDMMALHLRAENHPPLHHAVLKLWVGLAGASVFSLRLPSVVFGVGTVLAVLLYGRRLLGPGPALWAAWMLALSSAFLIATQEVRMYPLSQLLCTVGALAAACSLRGVRVDTGVSGIAIALAMLADVWGALVAACWHAAVILRRGDLERNGFPFRWWGVALACHVGVGAAYPQLMALRTLAYANPLDVLAFPTVLYAYATGGKLVPAPFSSPAVLAPCVAMAALLVAGGARLARTGLPERCLVATACVGLAAAPALYLWTGVNALTERRLCFSLPLLIVVSAVGAHALWTRVAGRVFVVASLAVLLAANATSTWNWLTDARFWRQDWKDAAAFMAPRLGEGDGVIVQTPYNVYVYRYYLGDRTNPIYLLGPREVPDLPLLAARHPVLWLVSCQGYQGDPELSVARWLSANCQEDGALILDNLPLPDARLVVLRFRITPSRTGGEVGAPPVPRVQGW